MEKLSLNFETKEICPIDQVLKSSITDKLFPPHLELIPNINEFYEFEIAYYESQLLSNDEIVKNAAYFGRVGDVPTRHYLMCQGQPLRLPEHSSSRLKSFFATNQFRTGYATHGLFPYRGKFHPQMIKGLINAMGLKPGETILDPMMGSGTVLIEATLMGINSIGIDASPFCQFMVQAKVEALSVPIKPIKRALDKSRSVFEYFKAAGENSSHRTENSDLNSWIRNNQEVYHFLQLSYLDSAGYSERSNRQAPFTQFHSILERYAFVSEKIQNVLSGIEDELGNAKPLQGDARKLPLDSESIDGIIFSPPYSFAIDYLKNDLSHLNFLGVNLDELRNSMIGLRGKYLKEKYELYIDDMDQVLNECSRVLRKGKICTIIVGTNNNQLSKIQQIDPEDVEGLDQILIRLAEDKGFRLAKKMARQIMGMSNTMRQEYIILLQKI